MIIFLPESLPSSFYQDLQAFGYWALMHQVYQTFGLMHQRRFDECWSILATFEVQLASILLNNDHAAMPEVTWRVYWGALAYYHYLRNEHLLAESCLDRAHIAIENAIAKNACVFSLANHCHEFLLHKARVSRSRKNWREMEERIAEAQMIVENRLPLCIPPGQAPIYYEDLAAKLLAIPGLTEADRKYIFPTTDGPTRRLWTENFVGRLRLIPGFVITYP